MERNEEIAALSYCADEGRTRWLFPKEIVQPGSIARSTYQWPDRDAPHPQSGHAGPRFVSLNRLSYCGEALTLVASFTGGSIVMFGPCTLGSSPAPGFSMIRRLS